MIRYSPTLVLGNQYQGIILLNRFISCEDHTTKIAYYLNFFEWGSASCADSALIKYSNAALGTRGMAQSCEYHVNRTLT